MPAQTLRIIDRDGTETTEATEHYRAADGGADNAVSDSPEGAARLARAHVPSYPGAVWAIWPTGTGRWAIREALRHTENRPGPAEKA